MNEFLSWKDEKFAEAALQLNSMYIVDMVLQYNNDADLGQALRDYVNELMKEQ